MLLLKLNSDALRAIQQSPEMITGQRVVGMKADERGESGHRCAIASLKLGKCLAILRLGRPFERFRRERLKGAQRLASSAQHQIANRTTLKALRGIGNRSADADLRAEEFVPRLCVMIELDVFDVAG